MKRIFIVILGLANLFVIIEGQAEELVPNTEVKFLVNTLASDIKDRTKRFFRVRNQAQEEELKNASIYPLGFLYFKEVKGPLDIYFVRVIIGNEKIFHVKISVEYSIKGTGMFGLNGKEEDPKNRNRYTVMQVLSGKTENDRLDKTDLF